jgi:hydrogenase maturation protein HypF
MSGSGPAERRSITVRGTVQGVGFRPFVYRLAEDHSLAGWVRNTGGGVEIEVEGRTIELELFSERLAREAPPLARIHGLECRAVTPTGVAGFHILSSGRASGEIVPVSPDAAVCAACLAEMRDPAERRFRYPFTNCTECGPRFTIIRELPYDRARTAMAEFPLCPRCEEEYRDPRDRRFHAEPIACPECGPMLEYVEGARREVELAVETAISALAAGRIVALKGLGGFQLACDAGDPEAVARLRARKHRDAKPFAVMVPDLAAARELCLVSAEEAELLTGRSAPIVLLRRSSDSAGGYVAGLVAPGLDSLGVMLPYTPLHHLLCAGIGRPLVMTSGNRSDEPIARTDQEALERLSGIADVFLLHDRGIVARYDDSVVRADRDGAVVLRRARGYAPEPIRLAGSAPVPVLALGARLKNAFCLARDRHAFVSQHIGDLDDALTLASYGEALTLYRHLFDVHPGVVAHDLHPDDAALRFVDAMEPLRDLPRVAVQHHHAHVVSVLAEHGITDRVIGVAFDGTGYGTDGAVWGGELLSADCMGFRRAAHLRYLAMPGGDAAAREPWRMAVAALAMAFSDRTEAEAAAADLLGRIPASARRTVFQMAHRGINAPLTSSAGRLFDAVAALAGLRDVNGYEGHAAMELEAAAAGADAEPYPLPLVEAGDGLVWDSGVMIRAVVDDVRARVPRDRISARFHAGLAEAIANGCRHARAEGGPTSVALSGGCFQNRLLLDLTRARLRRDRFRVRTNHRVPPNDGGVGLGQAAVAIATFHG